MGKVIAVCTSPARGTQKENVHKATLRVDYGVEGDAHAGNWHRQVSLLSYDKVQAFNARGAAVKDGAFGENLLVDGFDFARLPVGTRLGCGEVLLEITQIGKQCHHGCEIFQRMGDCIMPREGVFARVLHGGEIAEGDEMHLVYKVGIITASDKGSMSEREDLSGPAIAERLPNDYQVVCTEIVPDDRAQLAEAMRRMCDEQGCNLVLTTGGTGFAPRDVTPEATQDVIDRAVPGIAEAIRAYSMQFTSRAMLSRGTSGIRGRTLIVNLPGSPKAVRESMDAFIDVIGHGLRLLLGTDGECART